MFGLFKKKPVDYFVEQAKKDQKTADYPGCELGFMECTSTCCGCNEMRPSRQFVKARANLLKEKADAN